MWLSNWILDLLFQRRGLQQKGFNYHHWKALQKIQSISILTPRLRTYTPLRHTGSLTLPLEGPMNLREAWFLSIALLSLLKVHITSTRNSTNEGWLKTAVWFNQETNKEVSKSTAPSPKYCRPRMSQQRVAGFMTLRFFREVEWIHLEKKCLLKHTYIYNIHT